MGQLHRQASDEVTDVLRVWADGDERAFERLIPLVYDELHRMAVRYLAGERSTVSLQATALVNEICLRLLGWDQVRWQNRGHFFGVSAQMMRRVLVDIARRRTAPAGSSCRSTASTSRPANGTQTWLPSTTRSVRWPNTTRAGRAWSN
jgi:RNA polymerase sigma factor (TIGR02999 family)